MVCREDNSRYITKIEKSEWENRGKARWKSVENTGGGRNPGSEDMISRHVFSQSTV